MDGYLNTSLEIMAHAKQADSDLSYFEKDELLAMLRKSEGLDDLSLESSEFDSYYSYTREDYPKTWKKFIKYLVMFIQRRK